MTPSLPPPPRSIRLKPRVRRNLFLAILISIGGVALVLLLLGQVQRHERQQARLTVDDAFAGGRVTKKYSRRDSTKSGDAIVVESSYHVEYVFTAEGHSVRGIGRISKSLWDTLAENGPVGAYYTEGNPSVHQLVQPNDATKRRTAKILLYVCGAFVCLFLIASIDYLNRIRREQRTLRDWELAKDGKRLVNPRIGSESIALEKIQLVELV